MKHLAELIVGALFRGVLHHAIFLILLCSLKFPSVGGIRRVVSNEPNKLMPQNIAERDIRK